jgi:hypothetical protein
MTTFEMQVRAAITLCGISYKQLGKQSGVHPAMIGKFMRGERGLTVQSLGKILDSLGCVLIVGNNSFASRPRPVGRPKKIVTPPESLSTLSPLGDRGPGDAAAEVGSVQLDDPVETG